MVKQMTPSILEMASGARHRFRPGEALAIARPRSVRAKAPSPQRSAGALLKRVRFIVKHPMARLLPRPPASAQNRSQPARKGFDSSGVIGHALRT